MMRLVFLDTGALGMVANPRGSPRAVQGHRWTRNLLAAGVRVFVPGYFHPPRARPAPAWF